MSVALSLPPSTPASRLLVDVDDAGSWCLAPNEVLRWVTQGALTTYRLPHGTTADASFRDRRWALRPDIERLMAGLPLDPPLAPLDSHARVYVVDLEPCGMEAHDGRRCVYVGQSGHIPRHRFVCHLAGHKASRDVRRLARWFATDLMDPTARFTTVGEARAAESSLAAALRARGFGVHGGH